MLNLLSKLLSGLLPRRRRYLDAAQYNVHPPDLTFLTDVAPGRWVESLTVLIYLGWICTGWHNRLG